MSRVIAAGATSEALRPLLLRMASRGDHLTLIGRDAVALARTATALRAAGSPQVKIQVLGLDPQAQEVRRAVVESAAAGPFDIGLDFTGMLAYEGELDEPGRARLFRANCELPLAFLDAVLPVMATTGVVALAGSVAAIRPRASLRSYGLAKAALSAGIAERQRRTSVRLIELRFGPMATRMYRGGRGRAPADPVDLVPMIEAVLTQERGIVYLPRFWRPLGALFARLPQRIVDLIP